VEPERAGGLFRSKGPSGRGLGAHEEIRGAPENAPTADGGEIVLSLGRFYVAITHQSGVCPELIRTRVLHYAAAAFAEERRGTSTGLDWSRPGVCVARTSSNADSTRGAALCLRDGRTSVADRDSGGAPSERSRQYLAPLLGPHDDHESMATICRASATSAPEIARAWSLDIGAFGMVFAAGLAGTIPGEIFSTAARRRTCALPGPASMAPGIGSG